MTEYKGGCACGKVRFELSKRPMYVLACHCESCRKRTGGYYGVSVVASAEDIVSFTGETKQYVRDTDSGNHMVTEFCPNCGTSVRWQAQEMPARWVFAAGAFDNLPELDFDVIAEIYADDKVPFVDLGCDLSAGKGFDPAFRDAMIAKAKAQTPR